MKPEGLKPIQVNLKMRSGWEEAPLLPQNQADFDNHIPAHYLIQYELLGGNKMEIGNGCFGVVYTSVVSIWSKKKRSTRFSTRSKNAEVFFSIVYKIYL